MGILLTYAIMNIILSERCSVLGQCSDLLTKGLTNHVIEDALIQVKHSPRMFELLTNIILQRNVILLSTPTFCWLLL